MAILPLKTKTKGPSPLLNGNEVSLCLFTDNNSEDVVDEAIALFRANSFFRNFEIKGEADRVLIYLILFISECLNKITKTTTQSEAQKTLTTHALNQFAIPGEGGFSLNALYPASSNRNDSGKYNSHH